MTVCANCGAPEIDGRCSSCGASSGLPQQIGDRWLVEARLGAGGAGEVLKAREASLDRFVAIKLLREDLSRDPVARSRFEREGRQTAALRHPNIITVHAVGEHGGRPYIVMEYLAGEPLSRRLRAGPLPIDATLSLARQLTSALELLRERQILHRDIKPDNIFLGPDGHVTLLDFGLTLGPAASTFTRQGVILGTPAYMAPERLGAGTVDHRSDLYAFGLVLYECLTGARAVAGDNDASIIGRQLTGPVPDPQLVNALLSPTLGPFFKRALAKKPSARFASANALLTGLEHALDGRPSATVGLRAAWAAGAAVALVATAIVWGASAKHSAAASGGAASDATSPASSVAQPPNDGPAMPRAQEAAEVSEAAAPPAEPPPAVTRPVTPVRAHAQLAHGLPPRHADLPRPPAEPARANDAERERASPRSPAVVRVVTLVHDAPMWASVFVDGAPAGASPVRLELGEGAHVLRFERAGYAPIERRVVLTAGQTEALRVELAP